MTTLDQLAARAQALMRGGTRPVLDRLASAVAADAETLTLTRTHNGVAEGSVLGLGAELVYVWSYDSNAKQATVERGWEGTTARAHSAGTLVECNERFPRAMVLEAMRSEVDGWPPTIYRVESRTFSVGAADSAVELVPDWIDALAVVEARRSPNTSEVGSEDVSSWPHLKWHYFVRDAPAEGFYARTGLRIPALGYAGRVHVTVALPYTTLVWTPTTSVEHALGMPTSVQDLLVYGAILRLFGPAEVSLTSRLTQGQHRDGQEVPPGSIAGPNLDRIERMYARRLHDEQHRLLARYGVKVR